MIIILHYIKPVNCKQVSQFKNTYVNPYPTNVENRVSS